jgi:hypothetical protein
MNRQWAIGNWQWAMGNSKGEFPYCVETHYMRLKMVKKLIDAFNMPVQSKTELNRVEAHYMRLQKNIKNDHPGRKNIGD